MPGFQDGTAMYGRPTPELITRIRELRRRALTGGPKAPEDRSLQRQVSDLRTQVAHLEQLVQGLQDSVYRDARRHDDRLNEMQDRLSPAALAAALSQNARERGL